MSAYLGDRESLSDLESRMTSPDREIYQGYKNLRVEGSFLDRIYVIYKPTGLTADRQHREPDILGQVRVVGFTCDARKGCEISLENMETGELQHVGFIPQRLFSYDAFVGVPPFSRLRWDGRVSDGSIRRSLAFGILFKTRTRPENYSAGATMVETPKGFRQLYPSVHLPLHHI